MLLHTIQAEAGRRSLDAHAPASSAGAAHTGAPLLPYGPAEAHGYAHFALRLGSREAVDAMAARLRAAGVPVESGPRVTGDGYYEALVRDPDGNAVEIMA